MAMFEERRSKHTLLDDTHPLSCVIESFENSQGHTLYILRVHRGTDTSWTVSRRYSDFDSLNGYLQASGIELPLPPKKVFNKMNREFVAERQQKLQEYIDKVLAHPLLSVSVHVKRFLDPHNYSQNFRELALQHVSMLFRSEEQWEVVQLLPEIGWRLRKQYILVKPKGESRERHLLSWVPLGPDFYLSVKDLQSALKIISSVQHPHIWPTSLCTVNESGAIIIRNLSHEGSLRDLLYRARLQECYLRKYCSPRESFALTSEAIAKLGNQILHTLKMLHDRGLYHGHLHLGNVAILASGCALLDLENQLLGLPCQLRPFIVTLKKVKTLESIDVYSFGHMVYEMAYGRPCPTATCDSYPPSCPPELRSVLEALLTTEACKNGLPTIADLLLHPFFRSCVATNGSTPKLPMKFPSQLRESLKTARELTERRLQEDQRQWRHQEKLLKAHALLGSEEERKRRAVELKKRRQQSGKQTPSSQHASPTTPEDAPVTSPTSAVPPPPPPPPPLLSPPPPPPPPPNGGPPPPPNGVPFPSNGAPPQTGGSGDRKALLSSITGFNKGALKKAVTKDCSVPKL
uniref:Putative px domain-containing protein n=1 Tax=Ornithodoros turicata TaxID=34597 RepID=A0A2R5LNM3_9ACAR